MTSIDVTETDGTYRVVVRDDAGTTDHRVRISDDYLAQLGLADVDRPSLVEESFRFLLEREPKESILSSFDLSVIARYFSDYPDEIRKRLRSG